MKYNLESKNEIGAYLKGKDKIDEIVPSMDKIWHYDLMSEIES